jgi:hypothetical protein
MSLLTKDLLASFIDDATLLLHILKIVNTWCNNLFSDNLWFYLIQTNIYCIDSVFKLK